VTASTAVRLRELAGSDLDAINRWRNDPELVALLGGSFRHVCRAVDERWYESYLANRAVNVRLAIEAGDETLVGAVYLVGIDWVNRSAEFALWIGEAAWQGKRIGEAATRLVLAHAFDDLNLERIHLTVLRHNERAIRLYRKLGFVDEGVLRRAAYKGGQYRDLLAMAILRDEHAARREPT
jgi:RimJ/RimL family protein N-acetyltransferase